MALTAQEILLIDHLLLLYFCASSLQVLAERWDLEACYSPEVATERMYVRHAGFLAAVDAFDAAAFRQDFQRVSKMENEPLSPRIDCSIHQKMLQTAFLCATPN